MRVLVLGCGSIGTRRAKILAKKGHEVWCSDVDIHRAVALAKQMRPHGHVWVFGAGEGPELDAALVCTPPGSGRLEQLESCLLVLRVRGLYVEKPLALSEAEVRDIQTLSTSAEALSVVTMGACNLRFCRGLSQMRKIHKPWRLATLRMGQAAKYWNPAHEPVSLALDSIHELDLACWLQGPVESIRGLSTLSHAEMSVHHGGGGMSHVFLDRTSDPPVRMLSVNTPKDHESLRLEVDDKVYRRELEHFLGCVEAGEPTMNPLAEVCELNLRALEVV